MQWFANEVDTFFSRRKTASFSEFLEIAKLSFFIINQIWHLTYRTEKWPLKCEIFIYLCRWMFLVHKIKLFNYVSQCYNSNLGDILIFMWPAFHNIVHVNLGPECTEVVIWLSNKNERCKAVRYDRSGMFGYVATESLPFINFKEIST